MDLIDFNDPWEAVQAAAEARGPGSEPDHPGGPLYVQRPAAPGSGYSSRYSSIYEDVLPPPLPPQQHQPPPQPQQWWYPPPPVQQRPTTLQLPPFWADRPMAWFATVEARFRLYQVTEEQLKFDLTVNSLSQDVAAAAVEIIERPPVQQPYTALKHRLLRALELTDFQKIERLHRMEPLGGRKPSELLNAMLEFCPRGHEHNIFFTHLFLERLPAPLRIMLGEDDHQDPRQLAEKADRLWALHGGKMATIAAVDDGPADVAAVAGQSGSRDRSKKKKRGDGRGKQAAAAGAAGAPGAAATPRNAPCDLARLESGLCRHHFLHGERAYRCEAPCNWGN